MVQQNNDPNTYPSLREDLKISKMVQLERISYVVKDPLQDAYYRFDQEEWNIISLFDGKKTREEMVIEYNQNHKLDEIDITTIKEFEESLNSMDILLKSQKEMNLLLVDRMKEMRKSQLLSKKGSLLYKRFPVVDPNDFFDRIIDKVSFFWSKQFFIVSSAMMLFAIFTILNNWQKFETGAYELFSFNEMSMWNVILLWVIIYVTIAIHELGHGLTCKYYGGEVHEIGLLLLFFQPCLYCNVNDAWLFDKKWKRVIVTIAGGYIEFWVGSIFTVIWLLTSPNTFINIVSFQVMTIASISTIAFNFNPLIKLDGYYLLSDYFEIPNLKEDSGKYVKYIFSKYLFRMDEEEFEATKREKIILFSYGIAAACWVFLLLTGLVIMAKGMLVDKFNAIGIPMTMWVAYKMLGSHVGKGGRFLAKWYLKNIAMFKEKRTKKILTGALVFSLACLFIPVHYKIRGECTLEPSSMKPVRAKSDGKLINFYIKDGEKIEAGQKMALMQNPTLVYEEEIAKLNLEKIEMKLRKSLATDRSELFSLEKEIKAKRYDYQEKKKKSDNLIISNNQPLGQKSIFSCADQTQKINTFFKENDEICKILGIEKLFTVVKVSELDVRFLKVGQEIEFKLISSPGETHEGIIHKIRPTSEGDPINPKKKLYNTEIHIDNAGELRPGMMGQAKILANKVTIIHYILIKIASALRLDLFY